MGDFGILKLVLPSFWRKQDFLLFIERLPAFATPYTRRTLRLNEALQLIDT
jgi:hypothetical protein